MNKKFSLELLLSFAMVAGTVTASEGTTQVADTKATTTTTSTDLAVVTAALNATPEAPKAPATPEAPKVPATPEAPKAPATPEAPKAPATPEAPKAPATPEAPAKTFEEMQVAAGQTGSAVFKEVFDGASKSFKDNIIEPIDKNIIAPLDLKNEKNPVSQIVVSTETDTDLSSLVESRISNQTVKDVENAEAAKVKTWGDYGNAVVTHVKNYKWYYGTVGVAVLGYAGYKAYEAYQAKREADRERVLETLRSLSSN